MQKMLSLFIIIFTSIIAIPISMCITINCNRPKTSNQFIFSVQKDTANIIRIISYNIRSETVDDCKHGNLWNIRKHKIYSLLHAYQPDIIGLQEVRASYIHDLQAFFPEYNLIAFDIDMQHHKDVAILIRTSRFTIKAQDYFWLSDKPFERDIPLPIMDAKHPRIVTYVILLDHQTGKEVSFFSTHFDSTGTNSRLTAAQLLADQQQLIAPEVPVIIAGDLNLIVSSAVPVGKSEETYAVFTCTPGLSDVRDAAQGNHYGPDGTWIGWPYDKYSVPFGTVGERLDHMFVRKCSVVREGVLDLKVDNQNNIVPMLFCKSYNNIAYPSDHLPIIADVTLQ
jgi:endonuclease/exonuclease/phosphatase family metal-dependent hydrolase